MSKSINQNRNISLFQAILSIAAFGLYFYITHQLTRFSDFNNYEKVFFVIVLALPFLFFLSMPFYFWTLDRQKLTGSQKLFIKAAEYSLGYLNFILFFVVARDILGFVLSFFNQYNLNIYSKEISLLGMALPLLLILIGIVPILLGPKIIKKTIFIKNLHTDLNGFKVAQISDLHISNSSNMNHMKRVFKKTSDLNADMLALTGDIIDGNCDDHFELIKKLGAVSTKHGTFYCTGNHEYYWDAEKCIQYLKKENIRVLQNETEFLKIKNVTLSISGINDPAATGFGFEGPNLEKIKPNLKSEFNLLLCHQPFLADSAKAYNFQLQLSGHTHNGQFFPWNFLIRFFQKYFKGLYHLDSMQLYVNQGTGFWGPPIRLGTSCEITLIELKGIS